MFSFSLSFERHHHRTDIHPPQIQVPKEGAPRIGITGGITALLIAAGFSSTKIVLMLLEHGADPCDTDIAGNDALMMASLFGRTDVVKFWLERFPDWDLERMNNANGAYALSCAVYMGPHRLMLTKFLLDHGASLFNRTSGIGSSILTTVCSSEDCDPDILSLLLCRLNNNDTVMNYGIRGNTFKWRVIYRLARFLFTNNLTNSGLMIALAQDSGSTALHYAAQRGDVDAVNLLLRHGADPAIKNDVGKSPIEYVFALSPPYMHTHIYILVYHLGTATHFQNFEVDLKESFIKDVGTTRV
jgi:uncharacterized protein